MVNEFNLGNRKFTLGKVMLPAVKKNTSRVIHVGGEVLGEDQDIVHVDETERKLTQNKGHHLLKGVTSTRGILKLEHSEGSDESSLLNVLGGHRNLIIPLLKVQLGEPSWTRYPGGEVSNIRKRIPIKNCHIIHPPGMATRPPSSLLLTHQVERRRPGRRRATDDSSFLHGGELCFGGS